MVFNPAQAQLEALRGHYQLHFVDRPRATRSLAMLAQLRQGLEGLAQATDLALRGRAKALGAAWGREAKAVETAQKSAQDGDLLAIEALEQAQRLRWRARRLQLLAPEPRAVRPRGLEALLAELDAHDAALAAAAKGAPAASTALAQACQDLGHVAAHLRALHAAPVAGAGVEAGAGAEAEAEAGAKARPEAGPALNADANADWTSKVRRGVLQARAVLAELDQVVAGRSPLVVRPAYLQALVADLAAAHAVLAAAAAAGFGGAEHGANCAALAEQVTLWRQQLRQVEATRRQLTADELARALGDEADVVMEAADAAPGPTPAAMAHVLLCLRMDELHRQLMGVPLLFGHAGHKETLAGLADCLVWLERQGGEAPS